MRKMFTWLAVLALTVLIGCGTGVGTSERTDPGVEPDGGEPPNVYYRDKVAVLLYHDIQKQLKDGQASPSVISSRQLADHLDMLIRRGFRIITMDQFVSFMLDGRKVPPNAVVLTFDDGYESFYKEAMPVLLRFGATASNFIVGISSDLFNPEAEPHLTWDQMRELKRRGMGIYSHTYQLHRQAAADRTGTLKPALSSRLYMEREQRIETDEAYRQRIYSDMTFMGKRLEQELGEQRHLLAFPYGSYDDTVMAEGRRAGAELFFSIEEGINEPGGRLVKRINAGEPYFTADALWNRLQSFF